jgi:A/G-specific adenine glycosylase
MGRQADFPAARPRRPRPLRRARMLLLSDPAGAVLLQRRPPQGIWGGLWCLPELGEESAPDWAARVLGVSVDDVLPLGTVRHGFTHFELEIEPIAARVTSASPSLMEPGRWVWYNAGSPAKLGLAVAVSRLIAAREPDVAADQSKEPS